jgi:hypothetical protein
MVGLYQILASISAGFLGSAGGALDPDGWPLFRARPKECLSVSCRSSSGRFVCNPELDKRPNMGF